MIGITLECRMNLLFVFFIGFVAVCEAVRDCSSNNGGCLHYCIDRDDGNDPTCGCDCYYQLDTDLETCIPITACDVDILWLNDFSTELIPDCLFVRFGADGATTDFTLFETWRGIVSQYITAFSPGVENGDYVVGTMLNGRTLDVTNAYGAVTSTTTLASEISSLTKDSTCGPGNVVQSLYRTFDNGAVNNVITAPSGGRDGTTTTRVAVVGFISPAGASLDSVLDEYMLKIHEYYDHVFVYGRDDSTTLDSTELARYETQLRQLACNDSTANPCPYLFFSDKTNDNSASFNSATVVPMIDTSACITRKTVNVHSATCGVLEMTITIPSCLLGGLTKADLVLNDVSCTGTTHAVDSSDDIVFTIDYDDCNWAITSETVDSIEYITYTQSVVTADYGAGSNVKSVTFSSSCTFPRYTDEQLGIINPAVQSLSSSVDAEGSFPVTLELYQDVSYSTAYTSSDFPLDMNVMDRAFFAVSSSLPSGLKLILKDIVVTTDTDKTSSPSHTVMTDNCPSDDTFVLGVTTDTEIRFSLLIFEFATTVSEANGAKDPLYFHVTTYICEDTDTSDACTQACARRKKRDVSDVDIPVEHRVIGPVFSAPIKSPKQQKEETQKKTLNRIVTHNENKEDDSGVHLTTYEIYLPSPSFGVLCYWILLLASTALMFYLISRFYYKNHQNINNSPWNNFGIPTAVKG